VNASRRTAVNKSFVRAPAGSRDSFSVVLNFCSD
jgi:hypothetical protein